MKNLSLDQINRLAKSILRQPLREGGTPDPVVAPESEKTNVGHVSQYNDSPNAISHWNWRPLQDVHEDLGSISEIPSHVQKFGDFMDETAKKAGTQGLSSRDLLKAYAITLASIQRQAQDVSHLHRTGLMIPATGKIRPEGAMGEWLHTPAGQAYLDAASRGQIHEPAIADMMQKLKPYGLINKLGESLRWGAQNLPGKEGHVSQMVAAGREKSSPPDEWRDFAKDLKGIDVSKAGFIASMLGRGDQPTFDARQRILQTGMTSGQAGKMISGKKMNPLARAAVDRLADRQAAMNLTLPDNLSPYYQHLAHHTIWDKASNETTTHDDLMHAMRHAASGGAIMNHPVAQAIRRIHPEAFADGGMVDRAVSVARHHYATDGSVEQNAVATAIAPEPAASEQPKPEQPWDKWAPTNYKDFNDLPIINPQELVGKRVGSLLADLTRAGGHYHGIDRSTVDQPEPMMGGPGYPLLPESQAKKLVWAVQGKGKGTAKLRKDADYISVHAMMPDSHLSNASMSNVVAKTIQAYMRDKRISSENVEELNNLIRAGGKSPEGKGLEAFPGINHPDVEGAMKGLTFEARKRMLQILDSNKAQELGAPNMDKIARATIGDESQGVPYGHAMMLIEVPKGSADSLVHLAKSGLPVHPSYDWGIHGRVVGRFAHPVAPEILHQTWFDAKQEENKTKVTPKGRPPNLRRAFEMSLPVTTITQDIADRLPHQPHDIQSGKAAQLALNAFNDRWDDTDAPVTKGGVGSADFSRALRNSDSSSTLSQYSEKEINDMKRKSLFTGYKLKDGQVYFGLKRGTNYKEDYGFDHPDLTPNETALTSVVNNEPGAKGIGGAPVVLKAIQHGATALDAYAVPSKKHPKGFLPDFYSHFGFEELGRVPFDPQYVSENQLADMKHEWTKNGWDESMGMPSLAIMKWRGKDEDRQDAVRRYITQGGSGFGPRRGDSALPSAERFAGAGAGPDAGVPQGERGNGDAGGDRGTVRADNAPRPTDRLTRTLAAIKSLPQEEMQHFGLDPTEVALAKSRGLKRGGAVERALNLARQHRGQ